ncbi:class I SAM-dependent methyltransferase [Dokdonia ponticola]|uniref:Class I SAM-dependent methyltransferase n=1 Tax=Dokdonia ponticola TaxID=2041041 RepID=A0ABV9HVV1_9FLAO
MSKQMKSGLYWDQLYRQLNASKIPALWDVEPSRAVKKDFSLFKPYFNTSLHLIDIGCGTGTQTLYLSQHYNNITGIDVSKKAILSTSKPTNQLGLRFEVMDMLDTEACLKLHKKVGDSNIYMRGVLHQIPYIHRTSFVHNLKILLGQLGTIFMIETAPNIRDFISDLVQNHPEIPQTLENTLSSNFPPLGVSKKELLTWFPEEKYEFLSMQETSLKTNILVNSGHFIEIPAIYLLTRPKL